MKKLLLVFAVLALFTGTAFAGLTDLQVAELAADTKGHSVVSDDSVILKLWYTGDVTDGQSAGVSSNVVLLLYDESSSTSIATNDTSYDTLGELVDYINDSVTDWNATLGEDAYRSLSSQFLSPLDKTDAPSASSTAVEVKLDCSSADFITCGVSAVDNTLNRIKSVTHSVAGTGPITARLYSGSTVTGDTVIWRKDIEATAYNDGATSGASPNTTNFAEITAGRGISHVRGQPLVLRVDRTTINATNNDAKTAEVNLSITYDQVIK